MQTNKFLEPGAQRAAKVDELFAIVAPRYDLINDLQSLGLHRLWKRRMVAMAAVQPGDHALDLCCGTGDVAFALQRAGAEVTALDASPAMLAVAEKRAKNSRPNLEPVQFLRGDALHIPYPDASFNVVTVAYGLRNLSSWERGLEEMWRAARPRARLLVLDFGKPDFALWRALYFAYLKFFVPAFGKIFCRDSATHAYIFASLQNYPAQRGVAEKMKNLGCSRVEVRNLMGGAMSINLGQK